MHFTLNTILAVAATLTPAVLAGSPGPQATPGANGVSSNYCSQPVNENLMRLTGEANDNAQFCNSLSDGLMSSDVRKLKTRQNELRDNIFGAYSTLRGSSCQDLHPSNQRDLCRSFEEFTRAEKALQYALRSRAKDFENDDTYEDVIRSEAETQENYYHLAELLTKMTPVCANQIRDSTHEMNWAFAGTQSEFTESSH